MGISHDLVDLVLAIAGIAGPIVSFLVARYLGNVNSVRKEIRDLRENTADIRARIDLPSWRYEDS